MEAFIVSITVADLLKLPCLREARLVAGEKGLIRIVSSISVLEYAEVTSLHDALFKNNAFYGSHFQRPDARYSLRQ